MKISNPVRRLPAVLLGLALAACGGGSSDPEPITSECSIAAQNQAVYETMQQWYFWYEELPTVDPASFESPDALLDALRFEPLDRFSYITTQAEEEALFGESQFVGVGFRSVENDGVQVAVDVFEGGPADDAGLVRGSRILAVDGVPIADVLASPGGFSGSLGPREVGYQFDLTFENPDGEVLNPTLTKDIVTIPPVTGTRVFEVDGVTTGYLVFRNFTEPGIPALNAAFDTFSAQGVTQLIVDLRYNGGGLISVTEHFADLLASRTAPGLPFARYIYNDQNSNRNQTFFFTSNPPDRALLLDKVVLITTQATASASEILVNSLPPYITAATVGSATFGKPVGQLGFLFCEKVLRPVSFETVNSLNVGGYFDGIEPDCAAGDTFDVPFGTPGEASFDASVHWLRFGFCPQADIAVELERQREFRSDPPRYRPNNAF